MATHMQSFNSTRCAGIDLEALQAALLSLPALSSGTAIGEASRQLANSMLLALPIPGHGATAERFAALLVIGAHDLALVRMLEAHLDALAILSEAGDSVIARPSESMPLYAVWAARHPTAPLQALPGENGWYLTGSLPFCTGAQHVDRALIIAAVGDAQLLLHLEAGELPKLQEIEWHCAGMERLPASTFTFVNQFVSRECAVGPEGFYLDRRGFWCGAVGVAACWLGGAIGLMRRWRAFALQRATNNKHALAHLGASLASVDAAVAQLQQAGRLIDEPAITANALHALALSIRHVVEQTCEDVMRRLGRALGPGPMIFDHSLATQLADLSIYLRQCHAERDLEELGNLSLAGAATSDSHQTWSWL